MNTPREAASSHHDLLNRHGVLKTSAGLTEREKSDIAMRYAYGERAEIAMTICSMASHGDYFEFGADGLSTFRNYLTAFDLHNLGNTMPEARFFAFDIFGDDAGGDGNDREYFAAWSNAPGRDKFAEAKRQIEQHNLFTDRCVLQRGYFRNTLTEELKASLLADKRQIGTAFLDCNIGPSYSTCFDWILDLLNQTRCFIYMDEFYITAAVSPLYDEFCAKALDRFGLRSHFVRNAGGFGALFLLMRH